MDVFMFTGVSYFFIKCLTLLRDTQMGEISPRPLRIAAYLLHLPTMFVGPMHNYAEFNQSFETPYQLTVATFIECTFRIILGLVKVIVLSTLLQPLSLYALFGQDTILLKDLLFGAFIFSFMLYLDFSGLCDIAVGTSRLLRIDVPENFNYPFFATSISDFWKRWHITFSRVLTAYIFIPLARYFTPKMENNPKLLMGLCYGLTFLFCGLWHGANIHFLLWGCWHGLGLTLNDLWKRRPMTPQQRMAQVKRPAYSKLINAVFVFIFVSLGWVFFALPLSHLRLIGV